MDNLIEKIKDLEIVTADGLDDAIVGIGEQSGVSVAIYSTKKTIEALMSQGMDHGEACEFYDFNIACAYVGQGMPVFIDDELLKATT